MKRLSAAAARVLQIASVVSAVHMLENDPRQAVTYLEEAVTMRRAENNVTFLAVDLPMLGLALACSGEMAKALDTADEAVALYEQLVDDVEFRRGMWLAACTYRAVGAQTQAAEILARAYDDLERRRAKVPMGSAADMFAAIPFNLAIRLARERGVWLEFDSARSMNLA